ncbi:MAG: YfcE family phosphodiesterase [Patescibacteria group bacterium]|nr:YfcE family phosphodiesterase [Patescibacteria group bacterium]
MKIAIISDTHENLTNFEKFASFAKKENIKNLIHCGDAHNKEKLETLINAFDGEIFYVLGNADIKEQILELKDNPKIKIFKSFGEIEIDKIKMAFCHCLNDAKNICQTKRYNFVFYGHTHKPWLEEINNCILANPGNLAGSYYKASFAVLDTETKNLSLKILEEIK